MTNLLCVYTGKSRLEKPEKTPERALEKQGSPMALAKTSGIVRYR